MRGAEARAGCSGSGAQSHRWGEAAAVRQQAHHVAQGAVFLLKGQLWVTFVVKEATKTGVHWTYLFYDSSLHRLTLAYLGFTKPKRFKVSWITPIWHAYLGLEEECLQMSHWTVAEPGSASGVKHLHLQGRGRHDSGAGVRACAVASCRRGEAGLQCAWWWPLAVRKERFTFSTFSLRMQRWRVCF